MRDRFSDLSVKNLRHSDTRENIADGISGYVKEWEYDEALPPEPNKTDDIIERLNKRYEREQKLEQLQRKDGKTGWRQLIRTEIRAAVCQGAKRYKQPVANLQKDGRVLIAAVAGYVGAAIGFQAAIVAALVASIAHLIFRLGKEVFCASFVQQERFLSDEELKIQALRQQLLAGSKLSKKEPQRSVKGKKHTP